MAHSLDELLQEQAAYYRARAPEYDEWFLRQGRYDHGPALKRQWLTEVEAVAARLAAFNPTGRVLELACGTGWWTERLAGYAASITAVDVSPEVLALNRARLGQARVRYVEADLFDWPPEGSYDVVFFSFWLSHVPPERFAAFWQRVRSCLAPGGRVFFIDSLYTPTTTARDQPLAGREAVTMERRLNDGREFRIVKCFYRPEELQAQLQDLDWQITVQATENYFLFGCGVPANRPAPGR